MNFDNEKIEPKTDLELTLGYSNQCIQKNFKNDLGAGANANSRVGMMFLSTDPLSELVWSPDKGLSLRYADPSLPDKKISLLWDIGVGPSNLSLYPPSSIVPGRCTADRPEDENTSVKPIAAVCAKSGVAGRDILTRSPTSDSGVMPPCKAYEQHETGHFFSEPSKIVLLESAHEIENKSQNDDLMHPGDETLPGIHMNRNQGKENALSEGNVNGKTSKEDDDSHESVESCNISGLFSTGKKRWNSKKQLVVGSKRVKKQIQVTPCSTSYVKRDISFVNWISKKMKGISQSLQDEAISLALRVDHSEHVLQCPDQKPMTCVKRQDAGLKNAGFQSIFQSICNPSLKKVGTRMLRANDKLGEGSKDLELDNEVCVFNATPITCCLENDSFSKQLLQSNDMFEGSTCRYDASLSSQPKIVPVDSHLHDNKSSCSLELRKAKEDLLSNSSLGKHKVNTIENISSDKPSEGKATHNICDRSNPLGSSWITRFSPKSTALLLNSVHHKQSSRRTLLCSSDCSKLPHSQNHVTCPDNYRIVEAREHVTDDRLLLEATELRNSAVNHKASTWLKNISSHDDHKSMNKLNPIFLYPRFKNRDAIAPMFARRMDALKHIIPSDVTDIASHATATCLFCGIKGHQVRDCSEIEENELEDFSKNMNSYGEVEGFPSLCIKCFEPNHWAIACPSKSSTGKHQLQVNTSFVKKWGLSEVKFNAGNEQITRTETGKEGQFKAASVLCDEIDLKVVRDVNMSWKSYKNVKPSEVGTRASIKKCIAAVSAENMLKENHVTSSCNFMKRQMSDVPRGIFDAIRKLRLSRTDVLKWINSPSPLSNLDGFYVRLRLGKWEEGLGGTGYYVASITGVQRQSSEQNANNSLPVNVGGIKCLVESQYVSNHDFLEDELVAWWCMTLKTGGKTPFEENLIEKIKNKEMLRF
ncbi:Zinc finger, CCHC-type [Quillaja saponaria]|uniref:Zinc finger, CCHC-type n=1 Tax=Quillaja saponaria TaxID=32244 RepID=A0AAD7VL42_QUISA|nr:Zinc finger, CCHC-type [Quillaja saponaria]